MVASLLLARKYAFLFYSSFRFSRSRDAAFRLERSGIERFLSVSRISLDVGSLAKRKRKRRSERDGGERQEKDEEGFSCEACSVILSREKQFFPARDTCAPKCA